MGNFISRLEVLVIKLKNAKILYDYDNFQAAMVDYAYTSSMAGTGSVGFKNKQKDMKQFFLKTPPATSPAGPEQ